MNKIVVRKIIMQFHHQQEKLYFFQCKFIFLYDIAYQPILSIKAESKQDAIERFKLGFNDVFDINPANYIIRLDPKDVKKEEQ